MATRDLNGLYRRVINSSNRLTPRLTVTHNISRAATS